jgi:1,2-diacylglycerol 3-alpha-glucosyltransferase/glucuronosyltransferase
VRRLLIATDAWHPQINGVVRTFERMVAELGTLGLDVEMLEPGAFRTIPCPTYPEIRLAVSAPAKVRAAIDRAAPDHVHIATEGPLGVIARRWCLKKGQVFTTSFHTKFPEYLRARAPIPKSWTYAWLRRFHNAGSGCMVATASLERDLARRSFRNLMRWSRGVDSELFRPRHDRPATDFPRPVCLYVGRVAPEKNLEAFLSLDLPGSKVVVGEGPALAVLESRFPDVHFLGAREGEALAEVYSAADVFVFPSRTDTFGIVLLEALASGVPIAAYPVTGPADVIDNAAVGVLDEDLKAAVLAALQIPGERCRAFALSHGWKASAKQFLDNVERAQELFGLAVKGEGRLAAG